MKHIIIISILSILYFTGKAQSLLVEQKCSKIDSLITLWSNHKTFNGGLVIMQKGEIIYQKSAGFANFEKSILNTETTPFNLASISKPLTAVAIMQLVERNKLKLTDLVVSYLPDFPYKSVTIEQLLSHTSGLPEIDQFEKIFTQENPFNILSNLEIYEELVSKKAKPLAEAGEKHFYNNLNYILLANLLEKVSKMSFSLYMKKNVFEKANMNNSYIRERISPNTARYFLPTFYDTTFVNTDSLKNQKIYTDYNLGGTYGDNNVITTLQDMVLFDKALKSGKLLSQSAINQMYHPVRLKSGNFFFTGGTKTYTLGWNVNEKNFAGQFVAWHDGSLVGLTTIYFKNLTDDVTYIMYENKNTPLFFRRFLAVSNIMDGIKPADVSLQKSLVREFGFLLIQKGPHYATARFNELKSNKDWYFQEHEMNELGYQLLLKSENQNYKELSIEVFKMNTLLFPESPNVYDSYAEALMTLGLNEEAIISYKKAILLNPKNEYAKTNLKKLEQLKGTNR
ncbi:serine hydrolase domain-containing protein [Arundinibacter roseus]|uniref:Class A beta-lactamase-related serine hydrolase n=1 Tax=Arundinibacter roseus TaxID=2070510 RepID=A0A4R4K7K9_9BACT|nr:serine hydrolase domain-containing protein [Arundinibacter roseus]TDB62692.1 class A beta-lactamase-related serine hydrolase [Arundinibacter roseus]